jgi:hypothetical protein
MATLITVGGAIAFYRGDILKLVRFFIHVY